MDLEVIILCKVSQIEKDKYIILFTCRIQKNDTDELIYKTETDSQTQRMNLMVAGVKDRGRRDSQGIWDQEVHTAIFKMDNQQGPTVQHMELCYVTAWMGGEFGRGQIHVYIYG